MRVLLAIILSFISVELLSQQQALYTQFMYNKQTYNPSYVAVETAPSIGLVYRSQWVGIKGAPISQGLSFNMPLADNKIGVGMNIRRHTIGLSEELLVEGLYGYKIYLPSGSLSLGMQLSLKRYNINFTGDDVITSDDISLDPSIEGNSRSNNLFNFGFGAYYRNDYFFAGISLPRFRNVDLDAKDDLNLSQEERHIYSMIGGVIDVSDDISLSPQLLYRWTPVAPIDFDVNLSATYQKRYTIGLSYRLGGDENSIGESLDAIFSLIIADNLLIGFGYDYTLSALRQRSSGSIEFIANYRFGDASQDDRYINPRYF